MQPFIIQLSSIPTGDNSMTINQQLDPSITYSLFDANGEHCDLITPDLLDELGLPHSICDNQFQALTERERRLLCSGSGVRLFDGTWVRYLRLVLKDSKRFINLSDDDHDFQGHRQDELRQNLDKAEKSFSQMALAFGVDLNKDVYSNEERGSINQYWLDLYVPIERFEKLNTTEQMLSFFNQCDFSSPESIDIAIDAAIKEKPEDPGCRKCSAVRSEWCTCGVVLS